MTATTEYWKNVWIVKNKRRRRREKERKKNAENKISVFIFVGSTNYKYNDRRNT